MTVSGAVNLLRRPSPESRAAERADAKGAAAVAAAVRDGLARPRKRLPPWLFYDARGSALFEEITALPEYYLTRTERAILDAHAPAMIDAAGPPLAVTELGAGSATKTRLLLEALLACQPRATYTPVDVSRAALDAAQAQLRDLGRLETRPVAARYPEDLGFLPAIGERRLVLFLGSNLGNYDPPAARALLAGVRRHLRPGDAMLVGTDLRKATAHLLPAYDDARGVTARFNLNLLVRLNRELGADFDPHRFRHAVRFNARASRVELFITSLVEQVVRIRDLDLAISFAAGERIHTESSYKWTLAQARRLFRSAGFRPEATWTDSRRWFALNLLRVPAPRRHPR